MKSGFPLSLFAIGIVTMVNLLSCQKVDTPVPTPVISPTPIPLPSPVPSQYFSPCKDRPEVNATLIPVGSLSERRIAAVSGTVGSKIFFAGGIKTGAYSTRVDIYDTITRSWSGADLTIAERQGMVTATVGNKIFFAGGGDNDWIDVTSRIDIYDVSTDKWSTAELSQARKYLAAATLGKKVFFAGGGTWEKSRYTGSDVVDIYDDETGKWSTAKLSIGRFELSATAIGNKVYFAGGSYDIFTNTSRIDVFDVLTNSWSTEELNETKAGHAAIAVGNKIYWASGAYTPYGTGHLLSDQVEIKDITTGVSSFACIIPKNFFSAVIKGDNIIFFTGNPHLNTSTKHFEIYNTVTNQWSTGVLNMNISDASIISVNNTIYIAGGREYAYSFFDNVWKLEF